MPRLDAFISWFSGGTRHHYMPLSHCMDGDTPWIILTLVLNACIVVGYGVIALHWWKNQRGLPESPAKRALANMKNIFAFCGTCGYLFILIKMFWPAWRLYDLFLVALVYYTWHYAWHSRGLRVVYNALGNSARLANELEASRAEAKRKTYFLNSISHDLKTPLNALVLQAELAELDLSANDAASLKESLTEIKASARAAADLLNQFLELGRLDWSQDSNHLSNFRVGEMLGELIKDSQALADQKGLTIRAVSPSELSIKTDRVKAERILRNLLNNALKFTDEGGVQLLAAPSGDGVVFDVIDSGTGIPPEHRPHLFDEFYQVHNSERDRKKGFGLGLAIALRLAQQLGGKLTVESAPGRGSHFSLVLPDALARPGGDPKPETRPDLVGSSSALPAPR